MIRQDFSNAAFTVPRTTADGNQQYQQLSSLGDYLMTETPELSTIGGDMHENTFFKKYTYQVFPQLQRCL